MGLQRCQCRLIEINSNTGLRQFQLARKLIKALQSCELARAQIEAQRAVQRLEQMATDGNPAVQLVLPMAEMMGWLRKGVGELIRQAGLQIIQLMMELSRAESLASLPLSYRGTG